MTERALRKYKCLTDNDISESGLTLRPIQDEDVESIRVWRNSQMTVLRQTQVISLDQQKNYFDSEVFPTYSLEKPPQVLMAILTHGQLIGYGGIVHINWTDRSGEISFLLDTNVGEGSAKHCEFLKRFVPLILNVGFEQLGLHRIWTETFSFRMGHIKTLEDCGLALEGRLRETTKLGSTYVDSLIHAILETD